MASILQKITADKFEKPTNKTIITLQYEDKLFDAVKILVDNNIYSAPVKKDGDYIGMFELADVVTFFANNFKNSNLPGGLRQIMKENEQCNNTTIGDVYQTALREPLVPVHVSFNLKQITELLSKHKLHRVIVIDDDNEACNIITQSSLLKLISNQTGAFPILDQTLESLSIGSSPVECVDMGDSTISAFKKLHESKLYAVPVTNSIVSGKAMVSHLSCKDVKELCKGSIHLIHATVKDLLNSLHKDDIEIRSPSIVCSASDTLRHVVDILCKSGVHRVYILDKNHAPIKVISLTDVLLAIIST